MDKNCVVCLHPESKHSKGKCEVEDCKCEKFYEGDKIWTALEKSGTPNWENVQKSPAPEWKNQQKSK